MYDKALLQFEMQQGFFVVQIFVLTEVFLQIYFSRA